MVIEKFEDIIAWKKSKILVVYVYHCLNNCRDYSFKDQICRAVVSIMNNIAEGFERRSNKEFKNFLFISKGSCGEVRSMCYLAKELDYITEDNFKTILDSSEEISRMLSGLIKVL